MQRLVSKIWMLMAKLLHRIVIFLLPPTPWYGFSNQLHKKVALKSRVFRLAVSRCMLQTAMSSWLRFLRLCLWSLLVLPSLSSLLLQTGILIFFSACNSIRIASSTKVLQDHSSCLQDGCIHMLPSSPWTWSHSHRIERGCLFTSPSSFMQGCSSLCVLSASTQELINIFWTKRTVQHINVFMF